VRGSVDSALNDDQRLAALFRHEYAGLIRLAVSAGAGRRGAADRLEDAYAALWRHRHTLHDPNAAVRSLRGAVLRSPGRPARDRTGAGAAGSPGGATPSAALAALRRLPRQQRAALVGRHHLGLGNAELADLLGSAPDDVARQAERGLHLVAGQLGTDGAAAERLLADGLARATDEVDVAPVEVEERLAALRRRLAARAPGLRRRRLTLAAAGAVVLAAGVAAALGGDRVSGPTPGPVVTVVPDGVAEPLLRGGVALGEGRYVSEYGGVAFSFVPPSPDEGDTWGYGLVPGAAASLLLDGTSVRLSVQRLAKVYAADRPWVGQTELVPAPADPEVWFAHLAAAGFEVGPATPTSVAGARGLVADVAAPAELPASLAGCGVDRIPCLALAPLYVQGTGRAGVGQLAWAEGEVGRQWAVEHGGRLLVIERVSLPTAERYAEGLGEDFVASLTWR
jgi:hypothetical protein